MTHELSLLLDEFVGLRQPPGQLPAPDLARALAKLERAWTLHQDAMEYMR